MPVELLSGSVGGQPIKVVATISPGTQIHATDIPTQIKHKMFLWAQNTDTVDRKLTIEFGGVVAPDNLIEVTIPAESGEVQVVQGRPLTGDGAAVRNIKAFADAANVVLVSGYAVKSL